MNNCSRHTAKTEFILEGLTDNPDLRVPLFITFTSFYVIAVLGNAVIIIAIWLNPDLHIPMYFFVRQLAVLDLCYDSVITPNTLADLNRTIKSISIFGCVIQLLLFGGSATTESYLLAVMAYDRLVAICQPLLYSTVMSNNTCKLLVAVAYAAGYTNVCIQAGVTFGLTYWKHNVIDHFYCDIPPIIKLTCSDIFINEIVIFVFGGFSCVSCLSVILYSYTNILVTILKCHSASSRGKAFSTCASHLMCVSIFYGTVMFMYLRPPSQYFLSKDKIISVFYTVVIPMINPMIYSLRNTEVKSAISKVVHKILPAI